MINAFSGEYRFLSNFWPATVELDGVKYPSVEHAYVAAKTLDLYARQVIVTTQRPGEVKHLGRSLILRPNWGILRIPTMNALLRQKFASDPLRAMLLATGGERLVEGNRWGDTFWGVCKGVGDNHLGILLMRIRADAA